MTCTCKSVRDFVPALEILKCDGLGVVVTVGLGSTVGNVGTLTETLGG